MDSHGKVLVEKLAKFDGKEVDVFPIANLYALDVICGWFFISKTQALVSIKNFSSLRVSDGMQNECANGRLRLRASCQKVNPFKSSGFYLV